MNDRTIDLVDRWLGLEAEVGSGPEDALAVLRERVGSTGQERYVAQRLLGDAAGRLPVVRWGVVVALAAMLGLGVAGVGSRLVQEAPPPRSVLVTPPPVAPAPSWHEGWHLVTDAGAPVSIQVPWEWRTHWQAAPPLTPTRMLQARIGSAGLSVERRDTAGRSFEAFVDAYLLEGGGRLQARGLHAGHAAARIIRPVVRGEPNWVDYLVAGPEGVAYLVTVGWDPGTDLPELDAILGSFNPDGPGPIIVEPVR